MISQEASSIEYIPALAHGEETNVISVIDVISFLLQRRKPIAFATVILTGATALVSSLLPPSYKAEATILTPQQQQSTLSAFAAGAASGLVGASMASQLGLKNPADLYVGILKSRTIADDIVNQFHLGGVYGTKLLSQTRTALSKHVTFEGGKDSLIKISVEDRDPSRAAAIANAFIDELHKENSQLALSDASQRRLFFEDQLRREKDALASAEIELKNTQEGTGLVVPAGQAEVLIRSGAQLRAEIASREVQLQAIRSFATEENPQVQTLKREISALQAQLGQIESAGAGRSSLAVSGRKLPEASLEYIRKLRDVKYHETLFEMLAKQYEASRIDEAKQAPVIQVVDRATVPDKTSGPPLALLVAGATFAALLLSSLAVLAMHAGKRYIAELRSGYGETVVAA